MSRRVYEQKVISLLDVQEVTHPDFIIGNVHNVHGAHEMKVFVSTGLVETTANTNPGEVRVQISPSDEGGDWYDMWAATKADTGIPATEALTDTEPVGETVLAVAATAGFSVADQIYVENADLTKSEFHTIKSIISNTSFTVVDGLTYEQSATSTLWTLAARDFTSLSLRGARRVRAVYENLGAVGANSQVGVKAVLVPSLMG